jgi:hypothetical protein
MKMLSFGRIRTTLPIDVAIMIGVGVLNGSMMGGLGVVCLKRRSVRKHALNKRGGTEAVAFKGRTYSIMIILHLHGTIAGMLCVP